MLSVKSMTAACLALVLLSLGAARTPAAPSCDKSCLESIADRYRAAYLKHDPKLAPIASNVRFTENNVEMQFPDGSWDTVTEQVVPALTLSDPQSGNVGFYTAIMQGHAGIPGRAVEGGRKPDHRDRTHAIHQAQPQQSHRPLSVTFTSLSTIRIWSGPYRRRNAQRASVLSSARTAISPRCSTIPGRSTRASRRMRRGARTVSNSPTSSTLSGSAATLSTSVCAIVTFFWWMRSAAS